jgi:hypothetical protein
MTGVFALVFNTPYLNGVMCNSGGTLVAASHERCLLGEMVRGGLSRIKKLRYVDQFQ